MLYCAQECHSFIGAVDWHHSTIVGDHGGKIYGHHQLCGETPTAAEEVIIHACHEVEGGALFFSTL